MTDDEFRVSNAADQLTRYGGCVCDGRLLDVLDKLTNINDDICHDRANELVVEQCSNAIDLLKAIAADYGG